MKFTETILTVVCFTVISIHAMEEEIKPCTEEERFNFATAFFNKGCNYDCMEQELEKLAENFDVKKDRTYLRTLLCANKEPGGNRYHARVESHDTYKIVHRERGGYDKVPLHCKKEERLWSSGAAYSPGPWFYNIHLPFIKKAVIQKNADFLKIFCGLYSHNGSTRINCEIRSYAKRNHELYFDQHEAIKDEAVAKLLFANVKRAVTPEVLARCHTWPFLKPAGCEFALERDQQNINRRNEAALKKEQDERKWEQSLREVGK